MSLSRRQLLIALGGVGATSMAGGALLRWMGRPRSFIGYGSVLLGPLADSEAKKYAVGVIDLERGEAWSIPTVHKGHSVVPHPTRPGHAIMFGQRPGPRSMVVDFMNRETVAVIEASEGRHFYGHGTFSPDGRLLFSTENDYDGKRGVITIRDGATHAHLEELPSHGVGPHEMRCLQGGEVMLIANGGMLTHPDINEGYKPYDVDQMQPNLVWVETASGRLLDKLELTDHRMSVRHLAVGATGLVAVSAQDTTPTDGKHGTFLHVRHPGGRLVAMDTDPAMLARAKGHSLSVALLDELRLVAVTNPKAGAVTFWSTETGALKQTIDINGPSGIALSADRKRFVVTTSGGPAHLIDAATLQPIPADPLTETLAALGETFAGKGWGAHLSQVSI